MDIFEVKAWVFNKLMLIRSFISDETFSDISHYLDHDEYEIAFEYLLLEVMDANIVEHFAAVEVIQMALFLGLDKDFHYDENFWSRLNSTWRYV